MALRLWEYYGISSLKFKHPVNAAHADAFILVIVAKISMNRSQLLDNCKL